MMKFCMRPSVTKRIRLHQKNKISEPPPPALCYIWVDEGGDFKSVSESFGMTSEGLGEMFQGAEKFPQLGEENPNRRERKSDIFLS